MERESLVGGSGGTRRQAELMCWGWGCLQCRGSLCHCRGKVQRANHIHSSYFYLGNYWRRFKKIVLQTFGVTNTPSLPSPEPCCRVSEWAMSSQQQVDRASGEAGFHLGQPPPAPSQVSSARTSSWLLKLQTLGSSGLSAGSASR